VSYTVYDIRYIVETYKSFQKFQKTVTIYNFFFKSPIGIGYFLENNQKSPKKRNDLKFCNDLPCNDLYVLTVYDLHVHLTPGCGLVKTRNFKYSAYPVIVTPLFP